MVSSPQKKHPRESRAFAHVITRPHTVEMSVHISDRTLCCRDVAHSRCRLKPAVLCMYSPIQRRGIQPLVHITACFDNHLGLLPHSVSGIRRQRARSGSSGGTSDTKHPRHMRRSPENRPHAQPWLAGTAPNKFARTSSWLPVATHTDVFARRITSGFHWPAMTKRTPTAQRVTESAMHAKMDSEVRREVREARVCVTPHKHEHTTGQAGSARTVLNLLPEQVQASSSGSRHSPGKSLGARATPRSSSSAAPVGGESRARCLLRVGAPAPAQLEPEIQHDRHNYRAAGASEARE
jgi:hypothetical protein